MYYRQRRLCERGLSLGIATRVGCSRLGTPRTGGCWVTRVELMAHRLPSMHNGAVPHGPGGYRAQHAVASPGHNVCSPGRRIITETC